MFACASPVNAAYHARCNISRELAQSVAEDIGITLSEYLVAN